MWVSIEESGVGVRLEGGKRTGKRWSWRKMTSKTGLSESAMRDGAGGADGEEARDGSNELGILVGPKAKERRGGVEEATDNEGGPIGDGRAKASGWGGGVEERDSKTA